MFVLDKLVCAGCGVCEAECPTHALSMIDGVPTIDFSRCNGCQVCMETCPAGAIKAVEPPEPVLEDAREVAMVSLQDVQPVIAQQESYTRRRSIFPALGSVLPWTGREVLPRAAQLLLDHIIHRMEERQHRDEVWDERLPRVGLHHHYHSRQVRHRFRRRDIKRRCYSKS